MAFCEATTDVKAILKLRIRSANSGENEIIVGVGVKQFTSNVGDKTQIKCRKRDNLDGKIKIVDNLYYVLQGQPFSKCLYP